MTRQLWVLIGGCAGLWLVLAYPAFYLGGNAGLLHSAIAAVLCLLPAAATMLWFRWSAGGSPEQQLAAVMGGTGLRMLVVLGVGLALYFGVPEFQSIGFLVWIVVFYLPTLGMEVLLLVRQQPAGERARPPRNAA